MSDLIAEGVSVGGARVTIEKDRGRYGGARPYFIVTHSKRPQRMRYTPREDRARAIYAIFLRDITDPDEIKAAIG